MPIDDQFYKNLKPIGTHQEHITWGPGKQGAAVSDEKVKAAYSQSGQDMQPLGIHGTFVAVDWDDCIADGGCLPVCPVAVFEWLQNPGKSGNDDRAGFADKSDPVRESDCIFCMACVTVCPTTAIKVDQSLVEVAKQKPAPAQQPSPAQQPTPAPAPAQQAAPAQQPVPPQQPAQQPAQQPPQQPAQQPAQQPPPAPVQKPSAVQQPSQQPAPAPAPAQQPAPVQQPSQQPAPAPPQQPSQQPSAPQLPAQQLAQLAQQLAQLAQQLAQLAQQLAQQPAPAPAEKTDSKGVPQRNLPTN